jgi:hypothetical protein
MELTDNEFAREIEKIHGGCENVREWLDAMPLPNREEILKTLESRGVLFSNKEFGDYEKSLRFAYEYCKNPGNATQAYIDAGLSTDGHTRLSTNRYANDLLKKPHTQVIIHDLLSKLRKGRMDQSGWILQKIREVGLRAMQEYPVLDKKGQQVYDISFDDQGNETSRTPLYQYDAKSALKAFELLGKYEGIFSEKLRLAGHDGGSLFKDATKHKATITIQDASDIYYDALQASAKDIKETNERLIDVKTVSKKEKE